MVPEPVRMRMRILTGLLLLGCVALSFAAQGPKHRSLRAYAMGNAHVAIVDDKEAIYYNYAGLNQLGRLGNFKENPELGYYPSNYIDLRFNFGGAGPINEIRGVYDFSSDVYDLYKKARDAAHDDGSSVKRAFVDSLSSHPELSKKLNKFDHELFTLIAKADAEIALHNFGAALWVFGATSPYIDNGIIIPFFGVDTFYVDAVAQMGGAYGLSENLAVGAGLKLASRMAAKSFQIDVAGFETIGDTLNDRVEEAAEEFFDFDEMGIGMDLGVLYRINREVKLGASCNNIFFTELNGERILPNLTLGVAYSPRRLNRNTAFSRKVNFALDFENALSTEHNYKTLSHLNFGVELEQVLLAFPGENDNYRLLKLRLSGGFHGGYPSVGVAFEMFRFVEFEFATWGEESGYYTGQNENRIYMAEFSLGF